MAFHPNAQLRLIEDDFDPHSLLERSFLKEPPWHSITEFATDERFCGQVLYPRQQTLLRLIYLETEEMTDYDLEVIEEWRTGFARHRDVVGVQPDIWERIEYLRARGYRRFPHIQAVLGRRASKNFLGAIMIAEQIAYLISLDNPQRYYGIREGKDLFCNIGSTSQTQAQRHQFADARDVIEHCAFLKPHIAESKDHQMRLRTPADLRRIAEMQSTHVPVEHTIASLWIVALSASSVAGRSATAYCVDPMTPVLTADLRWVPIKSVVPGDELLGVDEYPEPSADGLDRRQRKLRKTTVLARTTTVKKAYRLTFHDGRSVVCSADHRWLLRRKKTGAWDWRVTRGPSEFHSLKVGDQIVQVVEPWEDDNSREAGYLAGLYDGEGSLYSGSGLAVMFSQNPGVVLDDALRILKEKGFSPQPQNKNAYIDGETTFTPSPNSLCQRGKSSCQQWAVRGVAEGLRFLGQVRPARLLARASDHYEGVAVRGKGSTRYEQPPYVAVITSIEELPEQELMDIQTTTGTFIANGLISHNCNVLDEFAFHVEGTTSVKTSDEIYQAWQPALGQVKKDGLTYVPSSPFNKIGKFYELYQEGKVLMGGYTDTAGVGEEARAELAAMRMRANRDVVELHANPTMLIFQGASWDLYKDWERGPELVRINFTEAPEDDLRSEEQQRRKLRNPDKFKVEREGQFAEVAGAYLDGAKVEAMFHPVAWREPSVLQPIPFGSFTHTYRIHADPSTVGANFALCVGHTEIAPCDKCGAAPVHDESYDCSCGQGTFWPHVIIDRLHVWRPRDFPVNPESGKHEIDYTVVERELDQLLYTFPSTTKFSTDQFHSTGMLQRLRRKYSPGIRIVEDTATEKSNFERAERFKSAINLGWVHSIQDNFFDQGGSLLEQECKYLSLTANGRVIKQDYGPVTTKDLYDAVSTVVTDLLHVALERWDSGHMMAHSFGSTQVAGLKSGREFDRLAQSQTSPYRTGTSGQGKAWDQLRLQQSSRSRQRAYTPDRRSTIYAREIRK